MDDNGDIIQGDKKNALVSFIIHLSSLFLQSKTVIVAQLVRASDCGSEGRGFEPRLSPLKKALIYQGFFRLK